ncbi:hypothetical protein MPTK1_2g05630 [Marchantia polymorpha subsp. ruderalis]|uniref:Uncharacterized protein n=1 Tax=Marchantia polymorpha TaxID=3197 RepID=A0A2R6XDF1_MARPO|nr:hypothetical protein MARPO_0021s0019 [Marchantia polymorpha]BBN01213.1 hypothetical protein Mp_2g05630 [Marchantia polymorpha subsp. ruderalis]|eukprot:PTQ44137.1 hypothetical protein MARPO_0021s0019 [Marchantia polymorpha]
MVMEVRRERSRYTSSEGSGNNTVEDRATSRRIGCAEPGGLNEIFLSNQLRSFTFFNREESAVCTPGSSEQPCGVAPGREKSMIVEPEFREMCRRCSGHEIWTRYPKYELSWPRTE